MGPLPNSPDALFIWQVIVDRKGKDIAISVDGTYRLLSVKGKTWPMIDGGPCSNFFSGGPGSEYTTTIINVLFLSCLHENEVCYRHYFESMKSLPVVLYNMQPFVPKVVGSDRARAIVNAREHVFPHSRSVLCWIHMDLYRKQGKFAKHMSSTCTIEERARIEADIVALHEMRTQEMFDVAFEFMEGVWAIEGEGNFAVYFRRYYGTPVWSHWWYRAALVPGVAAGQNPIEVGHSVQKKLLGPELLNASPFVFASKSAPLLLAAAGASNADPKKWPSTLEVKPRLTATVAAKAINLKKTLKTVKVRNFEARVKPSQDLPPWSNIEQDATWFTGLFFC